MPVRHSPSAKTKAGGRRPKRQGSSNFFQRRLPASATGTAGGDKCLGTLYVNDMLITIWQKLKRFFIANRKIRLSGVIVIFLIVVIGSVLLPQAANAQFFDFTADTIAKVLSYTFLWIASLIGKILVLMIGVLLAVVQYNGFNDSLAIREGWVVVRDVCNMFFVLVLLVIAFGTILRIENYKYNRLLSKLIIMAILVNFSRLIAGFFIDISQVVMLTFVSAFAEASVQNFTTMFKLQEMLAFVPTEVEGEITNFSAPTNAEKVAIPLFAAVMLLIACMTMIAMVVVFLMRIIMLWILVVLSPLAYMLAVLPIGQRHSSTWWTTFGKWVTTGPVLAFFLWLALTVLPSGSEEIVPIPIGEEKSQLVGGTDNVSVTASKATTTSGILGFMLSIGMLVIALSTAGALGGVAGSFAGSMLNKAKGMGSGVLKIAAAPVVGVGKVAKYVAGSGVRKFGRAMRESDSRMLNMMTPEFWKGFAKRGERLDERAKLRVAGKGEGFSEKLWKGEGAMDREELADRQIIETYKSEFKKEMGGASDSRQAMQDLAKKVFQTGGNEGEEMRQAFFEMATAQGNADDIWESFSTMYNDNEKMRGKIDKHFGAIGYKIDEENGINEVADIFDDEMSAKTQREFITGFLGLNKKFLGGENDNSGEEESANASKADQRRMRALSGVSEAAKRTGHWEQVLGVKDPTSKSGYRVMSEQSRRAEVLGESQKIDNRAFQKVLAPHVLRKAKWQAVVDEDGNKIEDAEKGRVIKGLMKKEEYKDEKTGEMETRMVKDTTRYKAELNRDVYAPEEGTFEDTMQKKILGGQNVPEIRQQASRMPDQLVARYFDERGNFVDSEEGAEEAGFQAKTDSEGNVTKSARKVLRDDFEKLYQKNEAIVTGYYKMKFYGKADIPGVQLPWLSGYAPKIESGELERFRTELDEGIEYDALTDVGEQKGFDLSNDNPENVRRMLQVLEQLTNIEYAPSKGFVSRQAVINVGAQQGKNLHWDPKRISPEYQKEIDSLEAELVRMDTDEQQRQTDGKPLDDQSQMREDRKRKKIGDRIKRAQYNKEHIKGYWKQSERKPGESDKDYQDRKEHHERDANEIEKVIKQNTSKDLRDKIKPTVAQFTDQEGNTIEQRVKIGVDTDTKKQIDDAKTENDKEKEEAKEKLKKEIEIIKEEHEGAEQRQMISDAKKDNKEKITGLDKASKEKIDAIKQSGMERIKKQTEEEIEDAITSLMQVYAAPADIADVTTAHPQPRTPPPPPGPTPTPTTPPPGGPTPGGDTTPPPEPPPTGEPTPPPEPAVATPQMSQNETLVRMELEVEENKLKEAEEKMGAMMKALKEEAKLDVAITPQMILDDKDLQKQLDQEGFGASVASVRTIQKEVDDKQTTVTKLQDQATGHQQRREAESGFTGGTAVQQSIEKLNAVTEQLSEAIESTAGTVSDLPGVIEDVDSSLGDFITAIEDRVKEFGKSTDERETKAAEQLSEIAKKISSQAQRSTGGTKETRETAQNLLIFQLRQLTGALRKSGGQSAVKIVRSVKNAVDKQSEQPE